MPRPPWKSVTGVEAVVDGWISSGSVRPCLVADRALEGRKATFGDMPPGLDPGLVKALGARGMERVYSHQARAIQAARAGRHVTIATPTASGKSLCFHVPVLDALRRDPAATALFLYPTKALSRDQESALRGLIQEAGLNIPAIVYDGDTPATPAAPPAKKARSS